MNRPIPLTDRQWTASLTDESLPVLPELLTDQVPGPLAAVAAAAGGSVTAVVVSQVTWWPGRSATVSWDSIIEGGSLAGRATFVGTTLKAPPEAVTVGDGEESVAVWRVPHDPFLPALAHVLQPEVAASVVAGLGGQITEPHTRLRAYRPSRRAVIEVTGQGHKVYLKLVKPRRLAALHQRHLDLEGVLPVPEPLGINRDLGLLAMRSMTGSTLRDVLEDPNGRLPRPEVIAGLPGTLPRLARTADVHSSIEALPRVAELLRRLLPMEADRIDRLEEAIGTDDVTDRVPAHGDYHEAQLLVEDGRVSGILDVDTLGVARPGDDPGTMLGHLAVWHTMSAQPDRIAAYATDLQQRWESTLDPRDLRLRAAARILGLAAGPFRVQQEGWPVETSRRLALAEQWVQSAESA
ncbi:aminoglycoside phosphotransferase family protein [Ornithinimicrobium faecis]|uniref:Aminoglycoside phosphotransferase family protein n=1 Tax=Ornithinimicrobium faecis TaxID=2934158 RepID=A0ABY4YP07_9MICO|nr:phosphotransferase [Ornithinimicrobium sp. HY1793]USQ78349.1 aminoglycoside phosphotransferase family protein [Ornithinimicrobium sp. HY1793]